MNLALVRRRRGPERPADERTDSFFLDSIDAPATPEPADSARRVSQVLIAAIALATALGVAGLFGLLQLLRP